MTNATNASGVTHVSFPRWFMALGAGLGWAGLSGGWLGDPSILSEWEAQRRRCDDVTMFFHGIHAVAFRIMEVLHRTPNTHRRAMRT